MATFVPVGCNTITVPVRDYVWNTWTMTSSVTTPTYYTQNVVWSRWTNSVTNTTGNWIINDNYVQNNVWGEWQNMTHSIQVAADGIHRMQEAFAETAEQLKARLDREQQERERRSRERLAAQHRLEGAQERALELLEMVLTTEERLMRDNTGVVTVRGSAGGLYEVGMGEWGTVHGNIKATDEHGCMLGRLCVAPGMYDHQARAALPLADGWVGQVLGLKFNEVEFVAKANWSGRQPCRMPDVPVLRAA